MLEVINMKNTLSIFALALGLTALPLASYAQEEATTDPVETTTDDAAVVETTDDNTVAEVEDDGTMEAVEDEEMASEEGMLALPASASEQGRLSSAKGMDTANQARQRGADFGRARNDGGRPEAPEAATNRPEAPEAATNRPGGRPER
jgi:hypothetical protein